MRVAIVGNSGSGKSTLAARLRALTGAAVLDLDTVAWAGGDGPPVRRERSAAVADVLAFCAAAEADDSAGAGRGWIVEGCYAELIAGVLPLKPVLLFLHPGVERCVEHCRQRPWEPHKYASPADQEANLAMLIAWVREYDTPTRSDDLSLQAHRALFDGYDGPKCMIATPAECDAAIARITAGA